MLSLFLVIGVSLKAQLSPTFQTTDGAIRGYDPVAYFVQGKPVKGNKAFTYEWNGADWKFANSQNLAAFKKSPEEYAPQYGGYCAYGTADGHKAPIDPEAWTIVNGKLYLNYDKHVKALWTKDQQGLINKADRNWPIIRDKK